MSILGAKPKLSIAAESAIASIGSAPMRNVHHAASALRAVAGSVRRTAGAHIGIVARVSDTSVAALVIGRGNSTSSRHLAGNVCIAGSTIRASSILTTSIPAKRTSPRIAATRRQFGSPYGQRKWTTSNSFVRTAIGSKLIKNIGARPTFSADIVCRRISEALKQPDMFIERPKPLKQEALFE